MVQYFVKPSDPPPTFRESPQDTTVKPLCSDFLSWSATYLAVHSVRGFTYFLTVLQESYCLVEVVSLGTALLEGQGLLATAADLDENVVTVKQAGPFHSASPCLLIPSSYYRTFSFTKVGSRLSYNFSDCRYEPGLEDHPPVFIQNSAACVDVPPFVCQEFVAVGMF